MNPLREGDKVYIILLGRVLPFEVINAVWHSTSLTYKAMHGINLCYVFSQYDIGKDVYTTPEAAEAALKERESR